MAGAFLFATCRCDAGTTPGDGAMPSDTRSLVDRLLAAYEEHGILPCVSGGDHDDNDDTDQTDAQRDADDTTDADSERTRGRAGNKDEALSRLGRQRDAERERANAAEKELADLKAAAQKAKDDEAAEQGKWRELAEKRDADLTDATNKLTAAETELTTLREYVTADLDAVAKTVRDAAKDNPAAKILLDFHPGEDAATADLIRWTKRAKAQLPELTKQAVRGNGPDPRPGGKDKTEIPSILPKNQYM